MPFSLSPESKLSVKLLVFFYLSRTSEDQKRTCASTKETYSSKRTTWLLNQIISSTGSSWAVRKIMTLIIFVYYYKFSYWS